MLRPPPVRAPRGPLALAASLCLLAASAALGQAVTGARPDALPGPPAPAPDNRPQHWSIDVSTTGQPITWTSPTSLPPDAAFYHSTFVLQRIEVTVEFLGIPFGPFDVTNQVPPDQLESTAEVAGPAPLVLIDEPVVSPPPPQAPSIAANLFVGIDRNGFGSFLVTNVVLGTTQVNLGFPFGTVTVDITGIRLVGNLTVSGDPWSVLETAP